MSVTKDDAFTAQMHLREIVAWMRGIADCVERHQKAAPGRAKEATLHGLYLEASRLRDFLKQIDLY